GSGAADLPDAIPFPLGVGRSAGHVAEPRHGRDRLYATNAPATDRRTRAARCTRHVVLSHECDPELGRRAGWEREEFASSGLTQGSGSALWRLQACSRSALSMRRAIRANSNSGSPRASRRLRLLPSRSLPTAKACRPDKAITRAASKSMRPPARRVTAPISWASPTFQTCRPVLRYA